MDNSHLASQLSGWKPGRAPMCSGRLPYAGTARAGQSTRFFRSMCLWLAGLAFANGWSAGAAPAQVYTGWWTDADGVNHFGPPPSAEEPEQPEPVWVQQPWRAPEPLPAPPTEPPAWLREAEERSWTSYRQGIDRLNLGDCLGAMQSFGESLGHWSNHPDAGAKLELARQRFAEESARAEQRRRDEERFRQQMQARSDAAIAGAIRELGEAQARRQAAELAREDQRIRMETDRILAGLAAATGSATANAPNAPTAETTLEFSPLVDGHFDPMVVDARMDTPSRATGRRVAPGMRMVRPNNRINPRAHHLLDAIQAGQRNWDRTMTLLKTGVVEDPDDMAALDAYLFAVGFTSAINGEFPRFAEGRRIHSLPEYQARNLPGSAMEQVEAGRRALAKGDFRTAHQAFRKAHQIDGQHKGLRMVTNWTEGLVGALDAIELSDQLARAELEAVMVELAASDLGPASDSPDNLPATGDGGGRFPGR